MKLICDASTFKLQIYKIHISMHTFNITFANNPDKLSATVHNARIKFHTDCLKFPINCPLYKHIENSTTTACIFGNP